SQFNSACAPELEQITLGMLHKNAAQRQEPFERLLNLRNAPPAATGRSATKASLEAPAAKPVESPAPPVKSKRPITRKEMGKKELKGAFLAFFWALVAIGLLAGIILGAINFWMKGAPPEVRVPNYLGMNQTDAQAVLKQQGLSME